jgi:hypothetical protein
VPFVRSASPNLGFRDVALTPDQLALLDALGA